MHLTKHCILSDNNNITLLSAYYLAQTLLVLFVDYMLKDEKKTIGK
jgi:hypothetical protein